MKKEEKKETCSKECECKEGKECTCEECNCDDCTCDECSCDDCTCDECSCEDVVKEINELNKTVADLEEKLKVAENNLLKEKAETINYRKRKDEEVARMLKYCNEDLIEQILPTLDNFENAIKLDDNDLNDELSKFLKGFKMVWCNLENVLTKFGVKPIDGSSKPFDPNYHEAILTEKIEGVEPGIVIEVLQKGYLLKDKVIRHAKVKVSE